MNKIATITFHKAMNYGATLQAVALQKTIQSFGHESEIINYDNKLISESYKPIRYDSIRDFVKSFINFPLRLRKNKKFTKFLTHEVKIGRNISQIDLALLENQYDIFLTGSDQVWNYKLTDSDAAYFLGFVNSSTKKRSYAASFGIAKIPDDKKSFYRKYLSQMEYISVREKTGAKIIKELTGKEANVDLDPVFLLDVDEWKKMMVVPESEVYIFVYMPVDIAIKYTRNLAKKTGLKIIYVSYSKSIFHPEKNLGDCRIDVSPEEFLTLIYNAKYVVTSSFHATAFSIIFNKNFYVSVPQSVGSRITNLLEETGIVNHCFNSEKLLEIDEIHWEDVNKIISKRRVESMRNLQHSLE